MSRAQTQHPYSSSECVSLQCLHNYVKFIVDGLFSLLRSYRAIVISLKEEIKIW